MTTTITIKRKQCGPQSEISQDLANKLYNNKGSRLMAIVELKSDHTGESVDGDRDVDLIIESIEPVVDGKLNGALDEHVRTIQQALYRNRALNEGQGELELDGPEPKVADVIAAGKAFVETDEDGQATGLWDGNTDDEAAADDVDEGVTADPESGTTPAETGTDVHPDPDEPHAYDAGPDDLCACGLPFEDPRHDSDLVHSFMEGMARRNRTTADSDDPDNIRTLTFSGKADDQ